MTNQNEIPEYQSSNVGSVLTGLLIGAAAGAVAMLLTAPQSGKATRQQIAQKGVELRERTSGLVDQAVRQVRSSADTLVADGRQKVAEMKGHGQELLAKQLGRVSDAAQSARKTVQGA